LSDENVELLRQAYERFNGLGRTDPNDVDLEQIDPDLWALLAPDVELHERPDLPDAKVYRGREESKRFWRKTWEIFSEIRWEPEEFIDGADVIVVMARIKGVGRGSEVPIEMDGADVFWFRGGLIARIQGFPSKRDALEAAGIDPVD
jgi:ketosteroid isomerase-like protein